MIAMKKYELLNIPSEKAIESLLSDLSNTSFTSTGFILTILTVLITFKANNQKKNKVADYDSALSIFFETPLYRATTKYLKDCIKSLLFVALIGFFFKIFLQNFQLIFLFNIAIIILIIVAMTLIRCVLILGKILKLQNSN